MCFVFRRRFVQFIQLKRRNKIVTTTAPLLTVISLFKVTEAHLTRSPAISPFFWLQNISLQCSHQPCPHNKSSFFTRWADRNLCATLASSKFAVHLLAMCKARHRRYSRELIVRWDHCRLLLTYNKNSLFCPIIQQETSQCTNSFTANINLCTRHGAVSLLR